jgi:site-specific DNA-methyltransferase (adenine-specific)
VWHINPKPYKGAHFATFPPDLIEPCILAGCPADGIVLDPFGGSGTTAGVAVKHGRKAILCELNPEYAKLIPSRVEGIAGDIDQATFDLA